MDDSSVKLTKIGKQNNIIIITAPGRRRVLTKKVIIVSSSLAELYPRQKLLDGNCILSPCLPINQWPVSIATAIEMTLQSSSNKWFMRLLSIKDQVNRAWETTPHWHWKGWRLEKISAQCLAWLRKVASPSRLKRIPKIGHQFWRSILLCCIPEY